MAWTVNQLKAINESGKNIIVSAGAGSGKTAVLSERVIRILKDGIDINRLLVLTFTKAAAAEMKERIRKKIKSEPSLSHVLPFVDQAKIMTFDAYSLSLVKKYYYCLNVSPEVSIADNYYLKVKMDEILDAILEEEYANNSEGLKKFFNDYPNKNDTGLKKVLKKMYYVFDLAFNTKQKLNQYIPHFYNDTYINNMVSEYTNITLKELGNVVAMASDLLSKLTDTGNDKLVMELEKFVYDCGSLNDIDEVINYFIEFKLPSLAKGSSDDIKDAKESLSNKIKNFKKAYLVFSSKKEIIDNVYHKKNHAVLMIDLEMKLYDRMMEFKQNNNYYSFTDIAKMAISLVKNNDLVKEEIKNNLYEILVDEYQDTSDLQEEFISTIANNNVYMVGDIKQSIYRFRNANPYIFKEKYESYSNNHGGTKIDLNENFRSREEVLDGINLIFNDLMTNKYGDANYKESHQMNYGLKGYDNFINAPKYYNMEILKYSKAAMPEDTNSPEFEAFYIAKDILSRMNDEIYDKDANTFRKAKFSDFCIIIDRGTNFGLIRKILEFHNIPVSINADSSLKNSQVSQVVSSLIGIVAKTYKRKFDQEYYHYLMSIGRSFTFKMDDDTLYNIVINKDLNNPISLIAKEIALKVDLYSLLDIYELILEKFNVVYNLRLIGNVNEGMIVLESIKNFIKSIYPLGETITNVSKHLKGMFDGNDDLEYSVDTKDANGVHIMNIHKSKGLEFPICYYALLQVKFNNADDKNKVGYFEETGMCFDTDEKSDISKIVGIAKLNEKNISERIRLFYVALTRAREKIIILSPLVTNKGIITPDNYNCLNDMLTNSQASLNEFCHQIDIEVDHSYLVSKKSLEMNYHDMVEYDLSKSYFTTKLTKSRISKDVLEVLSDEEQENIDLGLELHKILEETDFKNIKKTNNPIIDKVLFDNALFTNISKAKTFHEHEFLMTFNEKEYHGIIDLLAIYDDHIDIIDYKLSNINHPEYNRQLSIYKEYVKSKSDLEIHCYLLSLLHNEYKEVK